jgi:transposase
LERAIAYAMTRIVDARATGAAEAPMPESVSELQALLAARTARIAELEQERDRLRASHERLRQELELFKRRLFIAKAERVDTTQLELEFAAKLKQLDTLAGTLGLGKDDAREHDDDDSKAKDGKRRGKRKHNRGSGRRDLRELPLPEERVEIADPHLEQLVAEGKVVRHGFQESYKLAHKRGGKCRLLVARVRYKTVDAAGNTDVITTAVPDQMLPAAMAAPSLAAHVVMENIGKGMPLFRIEDTFEREAIAIDRGTLCRWKKLIGDVLGKTVVKAMTEHALATAFCISTDATGVCVQPIYSKEQGRQACKKAHFLVQIADADHIFFEYLERETSAKVSSAFFGFEGYVQADAKNVFDVLFCDAEEVRRNHPDIEPDDCTRAEVGCWYHLRRRFWEAAVAKNEVAREGLARIGRIFELDATWRKKPPAEIKRLREQHLRTHVEAFFEWVQQQHPLFEGQRGYVRTALGYARNQRDALVRFLDDGRLVMDNSRAERAIKAVALGRKAWLFCGSDDHAKSTAALFSIIASARLHGIEPEEYLRCLIRLVPLWPPDRMLELAPLFWARTRARLDPAELAAEIGPIAIPLEPLDTSVAAEQNSAG